LEDSADGNCESIKQILDLDSKTDQYSIIKQSDDEGRSALHKAALEGQMGALRLLVTYVKDNSPDLLKELLNATDNYGNTPFFQVCVKLHKSDHSMAEFLTEHGAKVDIVKSTTQMTPLHWAGYHGNSDLGAVILKSQEGKKCLTIMNKDGKYPIDIAGQQYIKKVYEASDQDVGDSILPEYLQGSTPEQYAAILKRFLTEGDTAKFTKNYHERRLYWACCIGATAVADNAIKGGANVNAINTIYKSQTAFHAAARHGHKSTLEILLRAPNAKNGVNAKDDNCNTPLIECTRMTNFAKEYRKRNIAVIKLLLESGADDMIVNRQNFRAVNFAKTPQAKAILRGTKAAKKLEDMQPPISWDWVLVFAKGMKYPGIEPQYEKVAKFLRNKKLTVDVCGSFLKPDKEVYVCVTTDEKMQKVYAEKLHYEVKLLAGREYREYKAADDFLYAPFKTQERMEITLMVIEEAIDIDTYLAGGVIKRMFAVHDELELEPIRERWVNKWQPLNSLSDYLSDKQSNTFEDLNHIRSYYGEKVAFYYAWFAHYTAMLMYILPFALANAIYQFATNTQKSVYLALLAVIMAIWSTVHTESWKRKQEELAYRWDMLDFEREEKLRPEFRGDENISAKNGFVEKYYSEEIRSRKKWISIPILITFVGAVITAFALVKIWKTIIATTMTGDNALYYGFLATIVNTVVIVVLDILWGKTAIWLTDWENWRTDTEWEDAYINRKFLFMFVNNSMTVFWAAFVDRDMQQLFMQMMSVMVGKQITNIVKDVSVPLAKTLPKRRALKKKMEVIKKDVDYQDFWGSNIASRPDLTADEVMEARLEVAENDIMDNWGGTVNEYSELMIQYAFVVLFTPAFPIAPVVAFVCNLNGIRGEMTVNTSVIQRAPTLSARDIGSWQTIQEALALASILSNVAILWFTMGGDLGTTYKSFFPTQDKSLWALIILEHILLLVKILCSVLIDDVPGWVKEAEELDAFKKDLQVQAEKKAPKATSKEAGIAGIISRSAPQPTITPKWGKLKRMMKQAIEKNKSGNAD
jgi:ankyrin repeat protein